MNRKKLFVAALVVNTAVLAFSAGFYHLIACQTHAGAGNDLKMTPLTGAGGKFGPVIEAILPAPNADGRAQILNLETGTARLDAGFEEFRFRADAIMTWVRTNGLDISCNVWPGGATCITYDMTVLAVAEKCWNESTAKELIDNPALAPRHHSARRLLVLGHNHPDTYMFRTGEGTLGMLRIVGLAQDGRGVKIRYKLITPAKTLSTAL